jgi:hypothetical protein
MMITDTIRGYIHGLCFQLKKVADLFCINNDLLICLTLV